MVPSTTVIHDHHARLAPHVDDLAATAALIDTGPDDRLRERLDAISTFLNGTLIPHMEAAERALFPELERLMQNRHSMTPMRNEHERIRLLISHLDRQLATLRGRAMTLTTAVALRRSLYGLYALLKVHLAEEELYADIAEHGLSPEAEAMLAAAMDHSGSPVG